MTSDVRCKIYPIEAHKTWMQKLRSLGMRAPLLAAEGFGDDVDFIVVATSAGRVVGFFLFDEMDTYLHASGTYVVRSFRRQGVGRRLWRCALRALGRKTVHVTTTTRDGKLFVESLRFRSVRVMHDHW